MGSVAGPFSPVASPPELGCSAALQAYMTSSQTRMHVLHNYWQEHYVLHFVQGCAETPDGICNTTQRINEDSIKLTSESSDTLVLSI